jgi:hypothetical protein
MYTDGIEAGRPDLSMMVLNALILKKKHGSKRCFIPGGSEYGVTPSIIKSGWK